MKMTREIMEDFLRSSDWGKEQFSSDFEVNDIYANPKNKEIDVHIYEFTTTDEDYKSYKEETYPYALDKREYELSQAWENWYTLPDKLEEVLFDKYDLSDWYSSYDLYDDEDDFSEGLEDLEDDFYEDLDEDDF